MDHALFSLNARNPAGWKFIDSYGWWNKGKKSTSKFLKHLKLKRCTIRRLNVLLFFKKIEVDIVKNVKNCSKLLIMWKLLISSIFFKVFHHVNLNFFEK